MPLQQVIDRRNVAMVFFLPISNETPLRLVKASLLDGMNSLLQDLLQPAVWPCCQPIDLLCCSLLGFPGQLTLNFFLELEFITCCGR
mmetsp:Transcript_15908/g.24555  ORF Transcript_15908/g.24555 Transcript_15908/m.24555 type:complete len:87 (-) Transcript_15908:793-1053(-)